VNKVIFTGTTEMGRTIVRQSTENFQRITLELGVKSPNIVFPDGRLSGSRQRRHDRHLLQPG
jgi:acyl-CoA reductase-like NAD-dependent aldehyde dehydrogenase